MPEHRTLRPDSKGRITLGDLARGVSGFRAHVDAEHRIVLEPLVEIPAREAWVHRSRKVKASLERGIADATAGRLRSVGRFAPHAADEID